MRARRDADLALDRADLVGTAAVRAPLVDRDLLADEVLVDRLGGPLDELPGQRVLDRGLALGGRRTDREGQLDAFDDPVEEQRALGRLELLRILLGVGQSPEIGLELVADRAVDGLEAHGLEQRVEALADLHLPGDVLLVRVHGDRGTQLREDLLDRGGGLAEAFGGDPLTDAVALRALELRGQRGVEPLRLAGLLRELDLSLAEPLDLLVRELEGLEQLVLRNLGSAGLDHRQSVERADDDQIEGRLLLGLLQRRVDDQLAVDQPHSHRAHRPREGQGRDHQRRRGPVDAEDVVRGDEVGREDGTDHLHLVPEALRPEGPDRAVDHARGQDRPLGGAALPLEETAGDLPGGVHPLLDVDRQREEVRSFARLHPPLGGREDHRLAGADDDCTVGLLGELAGLETDFLAADGQGDRGQAVVDRGRANPVLHSACNTHSYSSTLRGEWEFESAPTGARSNFHSPILRCLPTSAGRAP